MKAGLVLRTLAHLRWEQLVYRPIRRVQSYLDRLAFSSRCLRSAPEAPLESSLETIARVFASLPHLNPPLKDHEGRVADLSDDRFTFLNRTHTLKPIDWNRRYESHLWTYNLHYFNYSVWCARAYVEGRDEGALESLKRLVSSWTSRAQVGVSDGWDAYPVSLRVVNWIYAYALLSPSLPSRAFLTELRVTIHRQLDFLSRRIEYHLLANHIIKNAKAMLIGGLFFGEKKWIAFGRQLLVDELEEQVLEDGGHFERSPMYHAQVLADAVESFALLSEFKELSPVEDQTFKSRIGLMAGFLRAMSYPDGTIALFNDSANSEESRALPILESAARVTSEVPAENKTKFPQSGYYTWTSIDSQQRIIVDAGPPAVDYNTAHAHCDLLSYEIRLSGQPFIVDSGVHGYAGDEFREYARSTRAHNTVVFDGREQSEIWDTFRMGARAEAVFAESMDQTESWQFRGAYRPYFDRDLIHERRIQRNNSGEWQIADRVTGGRAQRAESYVHLHPDVHASKLEDARIECRFSGVRVVIEPFGIEEVELIAGSESPQQGWYFPDFGVAKPNPTICLRTTVRLGEEFGYRIREVS